MKQSSVTIASFSGHGLATALTALLLTVFSVGHGAPQESLSAKADVSTVILEPAKGLPSNSERPPGQVDWDRAGLSGGVTNVLKLFRAGVSYDVIAAYIETARIPSPNADEILYLHNAAFPNNLLVSLLRPNGKSGTASIESRPTQPAVRAGGEMKSQPIVASSSYSQPPAVAGPVYVEAPSPIYLPRPVVVTSYPSVFASYNTLPYYESYPYFGLDYAGFRGHFGYGGGYYSGYRGRYSHPAISVGLGFRGHGHSGSFYRAGGRHFAGGRSSYSSRGHSGHHRPMGSSRRR